MTVRQVHGYCVEQGGTAFFRVRAEVPRDIFRPKGVLFENGLDQGVFAGTHLPVKSAVEPHRIAGIEGCEGNVFQRGKPFLTRPRVPPHVGFRVRVRCVAVTPLEGTVHADEADFFHDARFDFQGGGEIRHGGDADYGDGFFGSQDVIDERLDAVFMDGAGVSPQVVVGHPVENEALGIVERKADADRDVAAAGCFQHFCDDFRAIRRVAGIGQHHLQVELRRVQKLRQRPGVVDIVPDIRVENYRKRRLHSYENIFVDRFRQLFW